MNEITNEITNEYFFVKQIIKVKSMHSVRFQSPPIYHNILIKLLHHRYTYTE